MKIKKAWIFLIPGILGLAIIGYQYLVNKHEQTNNSLLETKFDQVEPIKFIEKIDSLRFTDYDSTYILIDSLERICRIKHLDFGLAMAFLFKADIQTRSGEVKKAFNSLTKAYKISDTLKVDSLSFDVCNFFGQYYSRKGDTDKAIQYARKSLRFIQEDDYKRFSKVYYNIGLMMMVKKEYDESRNFMNKSMEFARKASSEIDVAFNYSGLGVLTLQEGNFKEAIIYSTKADSMFAVLGNVFQRKAAMMNIATGYYRLNELDKSTDFYHKALEMNRLANDSLSMPLHYQGLARVYRENKNLSKAVLYMDSCLQYERRIRAFERDKLLNSVETRFQLDIKNKDIRLLAQEKELQSNRLSQQKQWIFNLLFVLLFLLAITYFYYRTSVARKKENELLELKNKQELMMRDQLQIENLLLQQDNLLSRYQSIKSQISPHFLFNSFNSLNSLILTDQEKAVKFVEDLATVYRYLLKSNELSLIELREELTFLDGYFHLMKTRFGTHLQLQIELGDLSGKELIVPVTLQLLVENAVKHNVIMAKKPLLITIYSDNDFLVISNEYQPKKRKVESTKIGLQNIQKRFELLKIEGFSYGLTNDRFEVRVPLVFSKEKDS